MMLRNSRLPQGHGCPARSRRAGRRAPRREAGFTLAELIVSLLVFTIILGAVLALFVFNSRLARAQLHVADMQQSLRIAQFELVRAVRTAGRGGLPTSQYPAPPAYPGQLLPVGVAIAVNNNVGPGTQIAGCACAPVLRGTDVLTVRGVFNSPIYQLNPAGGDFTFDVATGTGSVTLRKESPTGVPQSLAAIEEVLDDGQNEALLLVSPLDDATYAIVEMDTGNSSVTTGGGGEVEFATISFTTQGGNSADYLRLSPGGQVPPGFSTVAYVGLLEEYQFYIREEHAIPNNTSSELVPRLSRARVYPGTGVAHLNDNNNLHADMADNVLDLQVALGVDTAPRDGAITEGAAGNPNPSGTDEWLFNHPADNPAEAKWTNTLADPARLFYVRINTLARTDRPDSRYQAPLLAFIEDKDYSGAPFNQYNSRLERMFRRRTLQTTVDLRNL